MLLANGRRSPVPVRGTFTLEMTPMLGVHDEGLPYGQCH